MKKEPKVAIVITTFNQKELLTKCLESLRKKTTYKNYRVYLIDDSGTGKIGLSIRKKFRWVKLTSTKQNLGFSGANNLGIRRALKDFNPDYVLLLNDDTEIVQGNWLEEMVNVGEKNIVNGIIGCKVVFPDGRVQFLKGNKSKLLREVDDVIGACFLVKREVIDEIGFLDEEFSPVYGEESDFCFRASKKGFKLFYVGYVRIIHYGGSSANTMFNETLWYIKKRNSIRLEWLNYSTREILIHAIIHLSSAILSKTPVKKMCLLVKAYRENIKNLNEIKLKRKERNQWQKK